MKFVIFSANVADKQVSLTVSDLDGFVHAQPDAIMVVYNEESPACVQKHELKGLKVTFVCH